MTRGRWVRAAIAVAGLAVTVELVSLLFGDAVNQLLLQLPAVDKVLHIAAFCVLALASLAAVRRFFPELRRPVVAVGLVLFVIAVVDEAAQGLQRSRNVEAADLVASLSGLTLGLSVASRSRRRIAMTGATLATAVAVGVVTVSFGRQRHVNAALQYERLGQFAEARASYQRALAAGADATALYNELGWVEVESGVGNPERAVYYTTHALERHPDDPNVMDTHGWALHFAGRSREALPFLERALEQQPDMFCIHYHLGEVYLAMAQVDKARLHFTMQTARTDTREAARAEARLAQIQLHGVVAPAARP